jgi:hypothetical protein
LAANRLIAQSSQNDPLLSVGLERSGRSRRSLCGYYWPSFAGDRINA